ncbi:MAG TPA: sigma-70 family RNA polymerase sigma factor [Myxococcales bacterium LLY-WYZ-16_1]|jgi:RNA polymerase sigma-70 factor, ECF subfamily|nr:sigma-70 family RNA polymerase sigma factor [Myxococcales bacterium LLY-WYZ-16_1]
MDGRSRENDGASDRDRDAARVRAARAGDRRSFALLVEAYQERVYAIAFGILRQREDAWDVAQEAFVKAYKNLDRFEGKSAFYTWLYRITYNLAIDAHRDRQRRKGRSEPLDGPVEGPPGLNHPSVSAQRRELAEVLRSAMDQLSEKHRAIIVLREVEGLSYEEMAEVLGVRKGTVMSRLHHARQNLQQLLRPYVETGETLPESLTLAVRRGVGGGFP